MRYRIFHQALLIAVLLFASCSSTPPSLMLVIDAEASVRARTTRIELDVRGAEGSQVFGQSYDLTMRGWPIRKSFVPRNGDLSRFIVATVSAFEAGNTTPLLVSRIRSGFANGQNEVRVLLLDGCIGQPCTEGNTCVVENGSPRCVPTPEVVPVRDAAVVDASAVDASANDTSIGDTSTTSDGCMPACLGRTCGIESACNTSCGSCEAPQTCNAAGRCETVSSNGPRFIDPPTIAEAQPIPVSGAFNLNMTVTDPQGVDTIVQAEVRNPTGVPGTAGRYQTLERRPGTGEYSTTIQWSTFNASNGGVLEDVSGTATRTLRVRFVDQDGNELVQDISVRLGDCPEALCAGVCTDCPENTSMQVCEGRSCVPASCVLGNHVCNNSCVSNTSLNSCGTACSPCPSAPANATATCDGTRCDFACAQGYHRCDNRCVSDISTAGCRTCNAGYMDCNNDCVATRYADLDGDGFGTTADCNGRATRAGDCDDQNQLVNPEAAYQLTPRSSGSYDYDCDGTETPRYRLLCTNDIICRTEAGSGRCVEEYSGPIAPCGSTGSTYTGDCYRNGGACAYGFGYDQTFRQPCR